MAGYGRPYSVSSIFAYLECPHQWWHRYHQRTKTDEKTRPLGWRIGSAVHAALEAAYTHLQMEGPRRPPAGLTMAAFEEPARARLSTAFEEEAIPQAHGTRDWAIDVLQKTLDVLPAPWPEHILGIEMELEEETPSGNRFIGYVDLALLEDEGRTVRVRDWKVTSHEARTTELACDLQLNSYGWFLAERTQAERVLGEHWYPPLQRARTVVLTPAAREDAMLQIDSVVELIEEDEEYLPKPGPACEWCPIKPLGLCPAWQAAESALADLKGF